MIVSPHWSGNVNGSAWCHGYKFPDDCPYAGVYKENDSACKECRKKAADAMETMFQEILKPIRLSYVFIHIL